MLHWISTPSELPNCKNIISIEPSTAVRHLISMKLSVMLLKPMLIISQLMDYSHILLELKTVNMEKIYIGLGDIPPILIKLVKQVTHGTLRCNITTTRHSLRILLGRWLAILLQWYGRQRHQLALGMLRLQKMEDLPFMWLPTITQLPMFEDHMEVM